MKLRRAALATGVALAFADSSIVVLALPDLLGRFHTSIGDVAWVITSYNVAVAAAALALPPTLRRLGTGRTLAAGVAVFAAASLACGAADSVALLVACRAVQGLGGALLLAGSLPLLGSGRLWASAGAVGTALGPAAGGLLTQALGWRAIFLAQAPVALVALAAVRGPAPPLPSNNLLQGGTGRRLRESLALALVSAALVGALFLVVVLLVDGWQRSPAAAAAVASALPLATLAASRLRAGASAGALLLAIGLAALALVPGRSLVWVVAALALAGLGLGLAVPELARRGSSSIGVRHAGLVLGLVLVAPLVSHDLARGGDRAKLGGAELVLDARLPLDTKVPLALALAREIERTPRGRLPDLRRAFGERPELASLERSLDERVGAVVTRSFRRAFGLCALLALAALVPVIGPPSMRTRTERRTPDTASAAHVTRTRSVFARLPSRPQLAAALAVASAVLGGELAAGAAGYGAVRLRDPCRERPLAPDSLPQRLLLRGLDLVACHEHESREALVLHLGEGALRVARLWQRLS